MPGSRTAPPVVEGGVGGWCTRRQHVFCTTALFTWRLDATDVSCLAGQADG